MLKKIYQYKQRERRPIVCLPVYARFCSVKNIFLFVLITIGSVLLVSCGSNTEKRKHAVDTRKNRLEAANYYLSVAPSRDMLTETLREMSKQMTKEEREAFVKIIEENIRLNIFDETIILALDKHFTADEIYAWADFYNTEKGHAIMKKIPAYSSEILPPIQDEMKRVLALCQLNTGAALRWEATALGIKAGIDDDDTTVSYNFKNISSNPVKVISVQTSAKYLTAQVHGLIFKPNDSGTISATFRRGDRLGHYNENIILKTNDPAEPETHLWLHLEIPEPLDIYPRFVYWKTDDPPAERIIKIALHNDENFKAELSDVKFDGDGFTSELIKTDETYIIKVRPINTKHPSSARLVITTTINSNTQKQQYAFARVISKKSKF